MNRTVQTRRVVAGIAAAALVGSGFAFSSAAGATGAPGATDAVGAAGDPPGAVSIQPDPSYQQPTFKGWGTSLVWFANATGGMPDEIRNKLADMVFGADGLNLNIARYNIGGGNAPDVADYLRPGGAVEGWWKAPAGTTRADVDWWNADDPTLWNESADQTQRWWIDRIKSRVDTWEAFSNSPPYFMTESGYVSGGFNSSTDQLATESIDDFAAYLVGAVQRLEDAHGIDVGTIDPFNEPNTPYWGTTLGADGQPVAGRQEGAHMGPEIQQKVIRALAGKLDGSTTNAVISAMDETNPGTFAKNWNTYPADVRALVGQLNVHTYGTGSRTTVRDLAKASDKPLWMSEVGGSWGSGQDFASMESGLGMAQHMIDDLRELEPSAWVFWQPVEDYNNMKPGGESAAGSNWGSIQMPFDCTAADTLATCPIYTNSKYNTVRNFTHSIRPGDNVIGVDDVGSVAAVNGASRSATVVHVNHSAAPQTVALDLSLFGRVSPGATVTPVITSADGALVQGAPVAVSKARASIEVPAESVTTLLVDGVSGVASGAALVQTGHVYRLQGTQSGKSLTPAATGAVISATDPAAANQLWNVTKLSRDSSNRARYAVVSATTGQRLAMRDGAVVLEAAGSGGARKHPPVEAQWIGSTTGDGTWTLVNAATGMLLEVGGQSSAEGAPVGAWQPTSGANQRWTIVDETVLSTTPVTAFSSPGTAPELPATVVPVYRGGARGALPVTWAMPADRRWARPGTVRVSGTATDPLGRTLRASATVTVDTIASVLPARAKAYVGGTPVLPGTVTGVGARGGQVELPVTWDGAVPAGAFDTAGVVTLTGTAQVRGGDPVAATVRVQVTAPVDRNTATGPGVVASATFTEGGYSPAALLNGDLTDKAWSNWMSGQANPSDTITVTMPAATDVTRVSTHFFLDGSMNSVAANVRVQARGAGGTWADASGDVPVNPAAGGTATVSDIPVAVAATDAVRVVLTARPGAYMTASEIEVFAKAPGASADAAAASIVVNGVEIAGFDPATTSYTVAGPATATVTATAADPYASIAVGAPDPSTGQVVVTVTSEDGTQTRAYTVSLTG